MKAGRLAVGVLGAILAAGCASSQPAPQAQSSSPFTADQQKALADPMHYSPNMDNTDITGGDIGHYDSQAMQRDVDDFWNP
jgi:hypothetical protein